MTVDPRPLAIELVDEFVAFITGKDGSQSAKIGHIESAVLRRYLPKIKQEILNADVNERLEMFEFLQRTNRKLTEGLKDDHTQEESRPRVIARATEDTEAADSGGTPRRRPAYQRPARR